VLFTLDQILGLDGTLDDAPGPDTPRERFRGFVRDSVGAIGAARYYVEACTTNKGPQYDHALQDLVNHKGAVIGFDVEFGRYKGVKDQWDDEEGPNPYLALPRMDMFTYEMGKEAVVYAEDGEFNGFSLTEFFRAKKINPSSGATSTGAYAFERPDDVSEFLEILRGKLSDQMKSLVVGGK